MAHKYVEIDLDDFSTEELVEELEWRCKRDKGVDVSSLVTAETVADVLGQQGCPQEALEPLKGWLQCADEDYRRSVEYCKDALVPA